MILTVWLHCDAIIDAVLRKADMVKGTRRRSEQQ